MQLVTSVKTTFCFCFRIYSYQKWTPANFFPSPLIDYPLPFLHIFLLRPLIYSKLAEVKSFVSPL